MDIKSTTDKLLKGDIGGVVSDVKYTIERSLGLVGLIIVTIAASIGSGLFVLPSFAAAIMGPGIWLAFLLAGLVFLPAHYRNQNWHLRCQTMVAPTSIFDRSFGHLIGTIGGMGLWASFLLKSAFALIGFSAYMYAVTEYLDISTNSTLLIMLALALITFLNILGIKKVKAFQTPILALTVALIVIVCIIQLFDANFDLSRPIDGAFDVTKNDPALVAEAAALSVCCLRRNLQGWCNWWRGERTREELHYGMLISHW